MLKQQKTIEWATFNRLTYSIVEQAKQDGLPLAPFTVHDLRRTGSTLLNELGFNSDWVENALRTRTVGRRAGSATRPNMRCSGGI